MSATVGWALVLGLLAAAWIAPLCAREVRAHRRRVGTAWEADLRRRQQDREVEESRRIGWRRG